MLSGKHMGIFSILLLLLIACFLFTNLAVNRSAFFALSDEELKHYSALAEKGDADAAFRVSEYYGYWAYGKPDSLQKELYFLTLAAKLGKPAAQYNLGYHYDQVEHNEEKALYWYKRAEKQNNSSARAMIKNLGRKIDHYYFANLSSEKLNVLRQQAKAGDAKSALLVSEYYGFKEDDKPNSEQKEMEFLALSADLGNPEAQYILGFYNEALFENDDKALFWYSRAEAQGHVKAKERIRKIQAKQVNNSKGSD